MGSFFPSTASIASLRIVIEAQSVVKHTRTSNLHSTFHATRGERYYHIHHNGRDSNERREAAFSLHLASHILPTRLRLAVCIPQEAIQLRRPIRTEGGLARRQRPFRS